MPDAQTDTNRRLALLINRLAPWSVVLAVVIAFSPALRAGFIWDDHGIHSNSLLQSTKGLGQIWAGARQPDEDHYWPVLYTAFFVQLQLWGTKPVGFHAASIGLHALMALLVYFFAKRRLRASTSWSAFASLVFALHPTKVESVAWALEQKDLISGLLYGTAFWCGLKFLHPRTMGTAEPEEPSFQKGKWLWAAASVFCFALALLTKTAAAPLPAALLVFLWWWIPRERGSVSSARVALLTTVLCAVGGAIVVGDALTVPAGHAIVSFPMRLDLRLLAVGRTTGFYLQKMLLPTNLSLIYGVNLEELNPSRATPYVWPFALLMLSLLLWAFRRELGRGPLAAFLFFLVNIAPVSGIIPFSYMTHSLVADRYAYLASLGFAVPIAVLGEQVWIRARSSALRVAISAAAIVLLVLYGTLSWMRCRQFESLETVFEDVHRKNPNAMAAYVGLGDWYSFKGQPLVAATYYRDLVNRFPDYAPGHVMFARALLKLGGQDEAIRQCRIALRLQPGLNSAEQLLRVLRAAPPAAAAQAPVSR